MYSSDQQRVLLEVSHRAIKVGLESSEADYFSELDQQLNSFDATLREKRACFVTLKIADELRGCVGSFESKEALVLNVAKNAYAAAFSDRRFSPLDLSEYSTVAVSISVLGPLQKMHVRDEADLLKQLQPGVDGLLLEIENRRGTFLPVVWESLPSAKEFLQKLKLKAGLPMDYWDPGIKFYRYLTYSIPS